MVALMFKLFKHLISYFIFNPPRVITLIIKSYIFKPAFSAADPAVIELIKTGPLPLTTIPCDPPSPGETLIDLDKTTTITAV